MALLRLTQSLKSVGWTSATLNPHLTYKQFFNWELTTEYRLELLSKEFHQSWNVQFGPFKRLWNTKGLHISKPHLHLSSSQTIEKLSKDAQCSFTTSWVKNTKNVGKGNMRSFTMLIMTLVYIFLTHIEIKHFREAAVWAFLPIPQLISWPKPKIVSFLLPKSSQKFGATKREIVPKQPKRTDYQKMILSSFKFQFGSQAIISLA